jgi:hypothetical protein
VNGQPWGVRLLWGFVCAFAGSLIAVVLAIVLVFATPAFHINWPLSHGPELVIVIAAPILIGALLGFAFAREAQDTASSVGRGLANAYRMNARRRH